MPLFADAGPFLIVCFWAACAGIGILIAQSRGYHPIEGALWGGLLGPIGVLVMLISADRSRKCHHCRGKLPSGPVTRCMHCGEVLSKKRSA